jgi:hypothetical protein
VTAETFAISTNRGGASGAHAFRDGNALSPFAQHARNLAADPRAMSDARQWRAGTRHLTQHRVARGMRKAIVDRLEAIEVEQHDSGRPAHELLICSSLLFNTACWRSVNGLGAGSSGSRLRSRLFGSFAFAPRVRSARSPRCLRDYFPPLLRFARAWWALSAERGEVAWPRT